MLIEKAVVTKIAMYYDKEWQEWQVRVWVLGQLNHDKSAFCCDAEDAEDTMKALKEHYYYA